MPSTSPTTLSSVSPGCDRRLVRPMAATAQRTETRLDATGFGQFRRPLRRPGHRRNLRRPGGRGRRNPAAGGHPAAARRPRCPPCRPRTGRCPRHGRPRRTPARWPTPSPGRSRHERCRRPRHPPRPKPSLSRRRCHGRLPPRSPPTRNRPSPRGTRPEKAPAVAELPSTPAGGTDGPRLSVADIMANLESESTGRRQSRSGLMTRGGVDHGGGDGASRHNPASSTRERLVPAPAGLERKSRGQR